MINEAEIGKRIREFRLKKNLTLQMLADRTGYPKGYLSKIEKSAKAPPVATLSASAVELDATLAILSGEGLQKDNLCVVRKSERTPMAGTREEFGYAYEVMANPYPDMHMELSFYPILRRTPPNTAFNTTLKKCSLCFSGKYVSNTATGNLFWKKATASTLIPASRMRATPLTMNH